MFSEGEADGDPIPHPGARDEFTAFKLINIAEYEGSTSQLEIDPDGLCSVCSAPVDQFVRLPCCRLIHYDCGLKWFLEDGHVTCPFCRAVVIRPRPPQTPPMASRSSTMPVTPDHVTHITSPSLMPTLRTPISTHMMSQSSPVTQLSSDSEGIRFCNAHAGHLS